MTSSAPFSETRWTKWTPDTKGLIADHGDWPKTVAVPQNVGADLDVIEAIPLTIFHGQPIQQPTINWVLGVSL